MAKRDGGTDFGVALAVIVVVVIVAAVCSKMLPAIVTHTGR